MPGSGWTGSTECRARSAYYGFSASRNPRTIAGVDARGRTLLATVDGRSIDSLGLTILRPVQ